MASADYGMLGKPSRSATIDILRLPLGSELGAEGLVEGEGKAEGEGEDAAEGEMMPAPLPAASFASGSWLFWSQSSISAPFASYSVGSRVPINGLCSSKLTRSFYFYFIIKGVINK